MTYQKFWIFLLLFFYSINAAFVNRTDLVQKTQTNLYTYKVLRKSIEFNQVNSVNASNILHGF